MRLRDRCAPRTGAADQHRAAAVSTSTEQVRTLRLALVGSPNSGKTTLFNALTGMRAKTGNYPGVTVARYEGPVRLAERELILEDLPGTYSLDPISPDERIVDRVLDPLEPGVPTPDGLIMVMDATALRRSLGLFVQTMQAGLPVCVVLTFTDELTRRQGHLDVEALRRALSVPVVTVTAGSRDQVWALKQQLSAPQDWSTPVVLPPTDPAQISGWIDSVLTSAQYRVPRADQLTRRIDAVLLHPVAGSLVFLATMFAFFQTIFTVAAPAQGWIEDLFGWLGDRAAENISNPVLGSFVSGALLGGVGGVLVFLPQIVLLFVLIGLLEGVGYMSRAAFLMDRVMAKAGLEGRAFVALLSSVACAVPGIMATRTLPSAKDRLATMFSAPLMTCAARLPVYVLLIGMLVDSSARIGPFGAQGSVMFALYLVGALSAMVTAWIVKRFTGHSGTQLPFYMEMPAYRWPSLRSVAVSAWDACRAFLRKVTGIILVTAIVLWLLLNLPSPSDAQLRQAGVDTEDDAAVATYVVDHSYAAAVGRAMSPVFEPLGFDWRVNVGVLSSLAAREVFVATLGQVAAAEDPEDPANALDTMTVTEGERAGEPLFDPPTIAALLVFFVYALQCMSTVGMMRRESGSWKWPLIAFGYMFALAWVMSLLARIVVGAFS
ncbi:MAG: ferrous iron transporter B [Micrococcales bacterium]|nr:MAG: ferrous iron transporter B [Micrococcales bacterium]